MECMVRVGKARWRLVGLYVNRDMERKLEGLKEWMEAGKVRVRTLIEGISMQERGRKGDGPRRRNREKKRKVGNQRISGLMEKKGG